MKIDATRFSKIISGKIQVLDEMLKAKRALAQCQLCETTGLRQAYMSIVMNELSMVNMVQVERRKASTFYSLTDPKGTEEYLKAVRGLYNNTVGVE